MSYEPSKRMHIRNLPPDVTKAEIVDLIRKRTRAQPSNIEIGKGPDGVQRQYAHVTVEGLKAVMENIEGAPIRGYNISVAAANPHYSIKIRDTNRRREREEEEMEAAAQAEREAELAALAENPPQLMPKSKVKSFYHYRQRYAQIASSLAKEFHNGFLQHGFKTDAEREEEAAAANRKEATEPPAATRGRRSEAAGTSGPSTSDHGKKKFGDKWKGDKKSAAAAAPPAPPPPPPPPSKEERKVAGLQAKLLALKAKLGK